MTIKGAFSVTAVSGTTVSNVEHYDAAGTDPEYYVFKNTNTDGTDAIYTVTVESPISLDIIAIGGGGAGSQGYNELKGSGGNSGNFINSTGSFSKGEIYTITIGGGGQTGVNNGNANFTAVSLPPTTDDGPPFIIITAPGGTGGPLDNQQGGTGAASQGTLNGGNGIGISQYIPSINTKYAGGGGAGGGLGGDGGTTGGDGGKSSYPTQAGKTEGSGGGGGAIGSTNNSGANGKPGILYFYVVSRGGSVCFLEGTPVETDQGEVVIDKLDTKLNTINGKRIVAVTKTPGQKDCLVLMKKDLIGENMPNKDTIISIWHRVLYEDEMEEACRIPDTELVPYNGETLYNVLLDEHETMKVNGLTVETLDPDHTVAKFYKSLAFHY